MSTERAQRGVTLVGLLVAAVIASLLMRVVVELFLASRSALAWQEAAARVEAAGQRALALLATELRMTDFRGMATDVTAPGSPPDCAAAPGWPVAVPPALAFADRSDSDGILLSDGAAVTCLPVADLAAGSDLLAVKRSATVPTYSRGVPGPRATRETQWYLAVDREGRGSFVYLGADPPGGALADPDRSYWEWHARIFYVRDYALDRGDGIPTLCVERLMGAGMRSECLVEGVERLHVEFALDSDGDGRAETRRERPTAAELAAARRATIHLLMRSVRPLAGGAPTAEFRLGSERLTVPAGPRFLRRVFSLSVPLMNHGHAA